MKKIFTLLALTFILISFSTFSQVQIGFPKKEKLETKLQIQFTPKEYELFAHLFKGKTYKEIAEAILLSVNTVKHYLKSLFQKLNVKSRHEAVKLIMSLK